MDWISHDDSDGVSDGEKGVLATSTPKKKQIANAVQPSGPNAQNKQWRQILSTAGPSAASQTVLPPPNTVADFKAAFFPEEVVVVQSSFPPSSQPRFVKEKGTQSQRKPAVNKPVRADEV